jgi:predicted Zn-dependent peptidase
MQTEVMYDRSRQTSLLSAWCVGFQNPEAVRTAFLQKIEGLQTNPITKTELAKAKKELTDSWKSQLESSQGVADAFTEAVAMGNANDVNTKFTDLKNVTVSDVKGVAKQYLVETGVTFGLMFPYAVEKDCMEEDITAPTLKSVGTRSTGEVLHAPHLTPHLRVFKNPQLAPQPSSEAVATDSQTKLWKRPGMVHFSVTFNPSIDVDHFTLSMMAANKDPQFQWEGLTHGSVRLSFSCQESDFDVKNLDKVWGDPKTYQLAGEKGKMMMKGVTYDINRYSEKLMREALFNIPKYNCKFSDAVENVKKSPRKLVAVAPDDSILQDIKNYFEDEQPYSEFIPTARSRPNKSKVVKQNKTNVKVLYGLALPGVGREHEDFIPLNIAASILGYGFHGMLMTKVRMEDGLTYGIESHVSPGAFRIGATFPPRNLEKGKQDIKNVLNVWKDGLTSEEVDIQKERLQLMHITLSDQASMYCQAQHTFLDESKIQACSHADVLAAFDKHINLKKLSEVVVG